MSKSLKPEVISKRMYRAGVHKTLIPRWHAKTGDQTKRELEELVRADRLSLPDYLFRSKYHPYLEALHRS